MTKIKYEFLIILDKDYSEDLYYLCDTEERLIDRLSKVQKYQIKTSPLEIIYNNFHFPLSISVDEVHLSKGRIFTVTLLFDDEIEKIGAFVGLTNVLKNQFIHSVEDKNKYNNKINAKFVILEDGISEYYANKSYEKIHKIENLMRKFIILILVLADTSNLEKQNTLFNCKRMKDDDSNNANKLYTCDFIELSDFLFKIRLPDQFDDYITLYKQISNSDTTENIDINALKNYCPRSLWDKHFSSLIIAERENIKKDWKQLYELRNKIAHNKIVTAKDYNDIKKLSISFSKMIEDALVDFNNKSQYEKESINSEISDIAIESITDIQEPKISETEKEDKDENHDTEKSAFSSIEYKGVLFDTNDEECTWEMVDNNKVESYYTAKKFVNSLNVDDIVFLYLKGLGLIGAGRVTSEKKILDEHTWYKDIDFLTEKPNKQKEIRAMPAYKIKEILGKNFWWASTVKVPYLSKTEAGLLLKELEDYLKKT